MSAKSGNSLATVLVAAAIVAALYFGREVLLPMALAVLLSFVLAPLVKLLQRLYLPRFAAVTIVVLLAFGVISGLATLMFAQVSQLAGDLPRYQSNLAEKVQALRGAATASGTLEQASQVLQNLQKELDRPKNAKPTSPTTPDASALPDRPIPVEVRQPDPGALQTLATLIAPLIHPLATTGLIIIFVVFILLQQQDLRNRLIRLAGSHDLQRTTLAMDDAGKRLSLLFLMQLALNAAFGLIIGVGLWAIGVPSAPLWGLLAMVLRFVPYIGAIVAAIFPLIVATAVDPGWSMMLMTAALFLVVEPLIGHVIEPMVYGHSSGLSPVAVVVSATFWTWLWGPIGLILATPLTMCLVVLGRHVERLKFLEVLLGDRPALSPSESAYQRMLAGDPIEATEQAQSLLKDRTLTEYYEHILMGALRLAWANSQRGRLEQPETQRIRDTVSELVEDLEIMWIRATHLQRMQVQRATSHNWRRASRPRFYRCHRSIRLKERCFASQALDCWMKPWRCRSPSCCAVKASRLKQGRRRRFQYPSCFRWKRKTSRSSVFATWNTRRQRNCITRRAACAGRQPACPHLSAFSTKQGRPAMAIRSNSRRAWSSCKALCLPV